MAFHAGRDKGNPDGGRRARGRAGLRGGPADEKGAPPADPGARNPLDVAFRADGLRLGGPALRKHGLRLPADAAILRASFGKVLEHFQGAFMGSVVARNDMFIGGIDFVWARIGGSGTLRNPDSVLYGGQTDLTLNEAFVTAFGGVRVPLGVPNLALYGTVGARNFYSGTKPTVTGPFGLFSGTELVNKDWVMPVAGFAAQYRYDDRWFMNVSGRPRRLVRQRHRTGARLGRLQLDAEHCDDARLSRHVHLHQSGHRFQRDHLPAQELPLPAVDVRAVRRVQVQLLKQRPREWT